MMRACYVASGFCLLLGVAGVAGGKLAGGLIYAVAGALCFALGWFFEHKK